MGSFRLSDLCSTVNELLFGKTCCILSCKSAWRDAGLGKLGCVKRSLRRPSSGSSGLRCGSTCWNLHSPHLACAAPARCGAACTRPGPPPSFHSIATIRYMKCCKFIATNLPHSRPASNFKPPSITTYSRRIDSNQSISSPMSLEFFQTNIYS